LNMRTPGPGSNWFDQLFTVRDLLRTAQCFSLIGRNESYLSCRASGVSAIVADRSAQGSDPHALGTGPAAVARHLVTAAAGLHRPPAPPARSRGVEIHQRARRAGAFADSIAEGAAEEFDAVPWRAAPAARSRSVRRGQRSDLPVEAQREGRRPPRGPVVHQRHVLGRRSFDLCGRDPVDPCDIVTAPCRRGEPMGDAGRGNRPDRVLRTLLDRGQPEPEPRTVGSWVTSQSSWGHSAVRWSPSFRHRAVAVGAVGTAE
jgi:hypothetical protein